MSASVHRVVAFAALAFIASGFQAEAQQRYIIRESGQPREFEPATDQAAVARPGTRRQIVTLPSVGSWAEHRERLRLRAQSTGERVEPVLYEIRDGKRFGQPRIVTREILVELAPEIEAERFFRKMDLHDVRPAGHGLDRHWLVRASDALAALDLWEQLRKTPGVVSADLQLARRRFLRFFPNDTYATNQWHLRNTGQFNGTPGMDVRVTNVWNSYRGSNVVIAIVDDGLQMAHPDLAANLVACLSWDFIFDDPDPTPDQPEEAHGTACAGVAAAVGNNNLGVSGVAPQARLVGFRLVGEYQTDAMEADALSRHNHIIHLKNNSWGPPDDGVSVEGPDPLMAAALSNACHYGRGGRGTLIFWAAGNGLQEYDNSNFDGYANSIYTIAIAAMDIRGQQAFYSEPGANIVVCAPSSGDNFSAQEVGIWTTDLTGTNGYNDGFAPGEPANPDYTSSFGGTSSATPLAAGVGALIVQARPDLGWRDVQEILIRTATRNDPTDSDWRTNAAGFWFNHKYGAGLINASGAVARALTWTNLGPQIRIQSNQLNSTSIPDANPSGVVRTFVFTNQLRVEHAVVTLSATHPYRGDLRVELVSPHSTTSVLADTRQDNGDNFHLWNFMSVRHWGESAAGTWRVRIADLSMGDVGSVTYLGLTLYGSAGPGPSNQPPRLTPIPPQFVFVTNALTFAVTASDPVDGHPITLSAFDVPPGAVFSATGGVGAFVWADAAPLGEYWVTFVASDPDGAVTAQVPITVAIPPADSSVIIDFEGPGETKTSYAAGNVTLSGYSWNLSNALIGTDSNQDRMNGDRAARLRTNGVMAMNVDFTNGVGIVSFQRAIFGDDAHSFLALDYSTNSGITWINAVTVSVSSINLRPYEANISKPGSVRLRFRHAGPTGSNRRSNVDDIWVTSFSDRKDDDGDGLNDYWELSYFTALTNVHALSDWDGDGFSDLEEFLAGTHPAGSASLLRVISLNAPGTGFVVQWQSASNRVYRLMASTNLAAGFSPVFTNVSATPPVNVVTDPAPPSAIRFYRIDVQP